MHETIVGQKHGTRSPSAASLKLLIELKTTWTIAVQNLTTDFVCLQVLGRLAPRSVLLELVASRVRTGSTTYVGYIVVHTPALHRLLEEAHWESFAVDQLHLSRRGKDPFVEGRVMLCLARASDAQGLADHVFHAVFQLCKVDDPARLAMVIDECPPREATRRYEELGQLGRLIPGQGSARSQGVALTSCRICGQPLSDPASARLGIGPDCRRRRVTAVARRVLANPLLDRVAAISAIPERAWRARAIRDVALAVARRADAGATG